MSTTENKDGHASYLSLFQIGLFVLIYRGANYSLFQRLSLFQRAKIQVICKQFTTVAVGKIPQLGLFQRAKIQDKCKQFTTT